MGSFFLNISGGQGWIRTSVHLREQIYSLSPLTTRTPTRTQQTEVKIIKQKNPYQSSLQDDFIFAIGDTPLLKKAELY